MKGIRNDKNPIVKLSLKLSFIKSTSISTPARNVSNIPPKLAI